MNAKQIKIISMIDAVENSKGSDISIFIDAESLCIRPFFQPIKRMIINGNYILGLSQECGSTGIENYTNMNSGLIFINNNSEALHFLKTWFNQYTSNISSIQGGLAETVHQPDQLALRQTMQLLHPKIYNIPQECNARFHPVFNYSQQLWCPLYCIHNHQLIDHLIINMKKQKDQIKSLYTLIQRIDKISNIRFSDWEPRTISIDFIIKNL